jgi:hypothetical protein
MGNSSIARVNAKEKREPAAISVIKNEIIILDKNIEETNVISTPIPLFYPRECLELTVMTPNIVFLLRNNEPYTVDLTTRRWRYLQKLTINIKAKRYISWTRPVLRINDDLVCIRDGGTAEIHDINREEAFGLYNCSEVVAIDDSRFVTVAAKKYMLDCAANFYARKIYC